VRDEHRWLRSINEYGRDGNQRDDGGPGAARAEAAIETLTRGCADGLSSGGAEHGRRHRGADARYDVERRAEHLGGLRGEYAQTKANQAYIMAVFSGPIPDAVWPKALQIVKDGAFQKGATEFGTFKDNPGDHDIYFAGPDGVEFRLGTQKASTLTAKSDCRLSQTDATPR
jgi:hypothetical protein